MERLRVVAADALLVGDSIWDVKASAQAGVACIGLECGGTSAAELLAAGALETWKDPADLLANLDRSALGGRRSEQQADETRRRAHERDELPGPGSR